jgi:hypothetical protein
MHPKKQVFLEQLVEHLKQVSGIAAIVLGGSHANGTYHEDSDLDVGLYYWEQQPFSILDIKRIAGQVSIQGPPVVTDFYQWGAWVNGGAWIQTEAGKVDFLYRNLDQVERTIEDAHQGITQHDYDQQPTHGFYSVIYLAETRICIPLYDPHSEIARLKQRVEIYPSKLREQIISNALWSAEFTLGFARNFAAGDDIYNTVGCLTRILSSLTQVLFALNERYFLSDKRVMDSLAGFSILPPGYTDQVNRILARPGETADELKSTVAALEALWQRVVSLAGEMYQSRY